MKMTCKVILVVLMLAFALAGTGVINAKEPFFEGLGTYKRKITTDSPEAQRYFNQGLAFYHGFNHGAAIRSFQEAARLDPKCAMAHWGIALACGPHINLPSSRRRPPSWPGRNSSSRRRTRSTLRRSSAL